VYIATVNAKTYYCYWFEVAVTSKVTYYLCMTSLHYEITFKGQDVLYGLKWQYTPEQKKKESVFQ